MTPANGEEQARPDTSPSDTPPPRDPRLTSRLAPAFRSASRLGWGFGDQALSSLTNFALGILVARSVSTDDLGAFGLALVTYWTALAVGRAVASQPLVIRYTAVANSEWRRGTAAATGTMVTVGFVAGLVAVGLGRVMGGALGDAFTALGLSLPGLLLQDCWRYAFLAAGRGRAAFINDLVWATLLFPSLVVVTASGEAGVFWLMLAWGGSATIAALIGIVQARVVPAPFLAGRWLRLQRDLAARYAGSAVMSMGSRQVGSYLVAAIGGLVVSGTLRAADLLLSPINVIFQGVYLIGVPEGVRAFDHSPRRLVGFTLAASSLMAGAVFAWGLVLFLIPEDLGLALLKLSWEPARSVVLPVAISLALAGASAGAVIGLNVLAAAPRSLRATTIGSLSALVAAVVGVAVAGAQGVAWAIVIVSVFSLGLWWWQFQQALADHRAAASGPRDAGRDGAAGPSPDPGL